MSARHTCFHKELLTQVKFSGLVIVSNKGNLMITHRSSPIRIKIEKIILNMRILFSRIYATQSRTDLKVTGLLSRIYAFLSKSLHT